MDFFIKPYEGDAPYIFASYAFKDTPDVFRILEGLYKDGFRIWYDAGIEFGSAWTEDIRKRMDKCSTIIAFVSKASVDLQIFQDEIFYAYNKKIFLLPLCLETVTLPSQLDWIFQQIPAMNFCDYNERPEYFLGWLYNLWFLQPAKGNRFALECSFKPYEGNLPYIFVSYSHKDSPTVFSIMEELNKAGFRIWYDEGIEWGITWTRDLEVRIERCGVVMVFISRTSVSSPHCRNEIVYACNSKKYFFPIYVEAVALPPPINQILEHIQAAKLYHYKDRYERFIERLCEAAILQSSKGQASSQWLLEQGKRYLQSNNEEKAFWCFKTVVDRTNLIDRYEAQQYIKEILSKSPVFKNLYEDQEEFSKKRWQELINRSPASYPKDKPRVPLQKVKYPAVFKEFEDFHNSLLKKKW